MEECGADEDEDEDAEDDAGGAQDDADDEDAGAPPGDAAGDEEEREDGIAGAGPSASESHLPDAEMIAKIHHKYIYFLISATMCMVFNHRTCTSLILKNLRVQVLSLVHVNFQKTFGYQSIQYSTFNQNREVFLIHNKIILKVFFKARVCT